MRLFSLLFLSVFFAGCSTVTRAPATFASRDEAIKAGAAWAAQDPVNHTWSIPLPTHSMEPLINESSIVLLTRYTGQTLSPGMIIVFDRASDNTPNVIHRVDAVSQLAVLTSGVNTRSDGWTLKTSVTWIVSSYYNFTP